MVVIDEVDEVLDAGERQLHPAGRRRPVEDVRQRVGVARIGPDDPLGLLQPDEVAAALADGFGHPLRGPLGSDGDAGSLGSRHGQHEASAVPPTAGRLPWPRRHAEPIALWAGRCAAQPRARARRRLPSNVPATRITIATTMISVAITCTCGGISTFAESKISRGNVDTLPAMNDVMM